MKALSKPLSSPRRAEKFPPPLMRFLRSNVGSRSRGRSRASPMFYLRSRKSLTAAETTQEPSSPKVTCIGQVRVRRSKKSKAKKTGGAALKRRRCWWLKKALFCGKISCKLRIPKKPFRWISNCKWGLCFRFGYCKKADASENSFRVYSNSNNQKGEKNENIVGVMNRDSCSNDSEIDYRSRYENLGVGSHEGKMDFLQSSSSSASPPKNAFLLTRCRSAPYRSSSLAGRFWGSPLAENEEGNNNGNEVENEGQFGELQTPSCENLVENPRISQELESNSVKSVEDLKVANSGGSAVHPLVLTRCKSEPARTGEKLFQEVILLRQTRLDAVKPCSQPNS